MTPFQPSRLLANGHLQTLFAALPPLRPDRRTALRIPIDGEEWLHASASFVGNEPRPTALLVHGTAGSSSSAYVRRATHALHAAGIHAVALDLRGTNASAPGANTVYHAGLVDDLAHAVVALSKDARVSSISVVGFSLGGQTSLLFAAIGGEILSRIERVIAVCAPLDLAPTARRVDGPSGALYRRWILRGLKRNAAALVERHPGPLPFGKSDLESIDRIFDFDDRITAPLHGFASADAYYEAVSSGPKLASIRIPTTMILAEDDPVVPVDTLDPWLAKRSSSVEVVRVERGGHLGFVETPTRRALTDTWLHRELVRRVGSESGRPTVRSSSV